MKAAAAVLGLLMLTVPAASAPVPALALTGAGIVCLIGSLAARCGRWASAGTLAATVAVTQCALWRPDTAGLAIEGLLVLGYLILLDGPAGAGRTVAMSWLRGQARFCLAGLAAGGAVLAALAVPSQTSVWIVLAGLCAAVAAYLVAIPRSPRSPQ